VGKFFDSAAKKVTGMADSLDKLNKPIKLTFLTPKIPDMPNTGGATPDGGGDGGKKGAGNDKIKKANEGYMKIIKDTQDKVVSVRTKFNETMVEHCNDISDENAVWFDGELERMMQSATPDSINQRVVDSELDTDYLLKGAELNKLEIRALAGLADSLGDHLQNCQDHGNELRDDVINLREKVDGTQKRIADRIAPKK
jgi:hypothetical protein